VIEELHISSLVVHSTPKRVMRVSDVIGAIEGAQIHATSPNGKLVVTLEASTADEMISKVNRIQQTDGVLSAALVYESVDTMEAMDEVIPDADDAKGIH
jgi:periplasmic nitrate reductase NapD